MKRVIEMSEREENQRVVQQKVQEQEAIKKVQDDQKSLQQQLEKERAMRA